MILASSPKPEIHIPVFVSSSILISLNSKMEIRKWKIEDRKWKMENREMQIATKFLWLDFVPNKKCPEIYSWISIHGYP